MIAGFAIRHNRRLSEYNFIRALKLSLLNKENMTGMMTSVGIGGRHCPGGTADASHTQLHNNLSTGQLRGGSTVIRYPYFLVPSRMSPHV
jgi:hypothetical protein